MQTQDDHAGTEDKAEEQAPEHGDSGATSEHGAETAGGAGSAAQQSTGDADDDDGDVRVTQELSRLGQRLAGAIRAAAGTPEAEQLRDEVGEGVRRLKGELDDVMRRGRSAGEEVVEAVEAAPDVAGKRAESVGTTLRNEIAGAIRALNGTLESMAKRIGAGQPAPAADAEHDRDTGA